MRRRSFLVGSLVLATVLTGTFGAMMLTLPATSASATPVAIDADETAATIAALKPPKRTRPVVAIIGANDGTETTDYLIPYGVLKRADVADVYALGTQSGAIEMMPALKILPNASSAEFDAKYPDGADYVIVPAMHRSDDSATIAWIKKQASHGAIIIGICTGAKVLGFAGLLDGRRATTHWYDLSGIQKQNPSMQHVSNRRFVVDRGVATTTGVTASVPMSLTLVEAIAGHERAAEVAKDLGVDHWDARHDSSAFRTTRGFYRAAIGNTVAFWAHEKLGLGVETGVDEIALGLTADAWSRTYRSSALTIASSSAPVFTKGGIGIVPDRIVPTGKIKHMLPAISSVEPVKALDKALTDIAARYGQRTREFVALQLEYPSAVQAR